MKMHRVPLFRIVVTQKTERYLRICSQSADRSFRLLWVLFAVVLVGGTISVAADDEFPPELVRFRAAEGNPIFTARGEGHWDARIRERGWILREGDTYHMWFTGYDASREGAKMLGYATSKDGLKWKRYPGNPIYREHWVEDMMVVKHRNTYYMFAEGRDDQAHLLTSKDKVNWKRHGPLDVRLTSGKPIPPGAYGTPTGWFENDKWYLLYERRDLGVWLATSKDLKVWTKVQDEPVFRPGPDAYDKDMIALNQVVKHKGRYYAYYHGLGRANGKWTTNVITSTDLIHWKKYAKNPLFPVAENKSSGILVNDGKQYRLYTMHDQVRVHFPRGK